MFDHPDWRKKPLATAARLLTSKIRQRVPAWHKAAIPYDTGCKIEVDVTTPFGYGLYRYGHSDPDVAFVRQLLRAGDVFVDGGAHIGLFTLPAADAVGPTGKVIAFEPAEQTRRSLERNIALSRFSDRVEVRPNALADKSETRTFYAFGEAAWGSSSFAPPDDLPDRRAETVQTVTLDATLSGPDFARIRLVKLDLEGAELAALHGAKRLLSEVRPDLLIEIEPEHLARQGASVPQILAFLREYGYRFYRIEEQNGSVVLVPADSPAPGRPNLLASVKKSL